MYTRNDSAIGPLVIALGANLGDPELAFDRATFEIGERIGRVVASSRRIRTKAVTMPGDSTAQPDYLNACLLVDSPLRPEDVLRRLLEIERDIGRDRSAEKSRWLPRVIDLDLIVAGDAVVETAELRVPHPEMHRRRFVLEPMADILPGWVHPLLRKDVREMLSSLPAD